MVEHRQQNKRILKNTFFLYIRMAIMMIVSLFTSRITLRALGVEDYGIYNVVGGIVIFLAFWLEIDLECLETMSCHVSKLLSEVFCREKLIGKINLIHWEE